MSDIENFRNAVERFDEILVELDRTNDSLENNLSKIDNETLQNVEKMLLKFQSENEEMREVFASSSEKIKEFKDEIGDLARIYYSGLIKDYKKSLEHINELSVEKMQSHTNRIEKIFSQNSQQRETELLQFKRLEKDFFDRYNKNFSDTKKDIKELTKFKKLTLFNLFFFGLFIGVGIGYFL